MAKVFLCASTIVLMAMLPSRGEAQTSCGAPTLSDQQVRSIIQRERSSRTDLPPALSPSTSEVRRQRCYYVYIERSEPVTPDSSLIFKLNARGVIVDVEIGNSGRSAMQCPEHTFTEAELADVVKKARAARRDLPSAFQRSRVRVDRVRCLYLYFEYAVPESRGNYQVFTIDPYGEVMDVTRPQPY